MIVWVWGVLVLAFVRVCEGGERQRQRRRDRERQGDRETERQGDRETERQRDRERAREGERERDRQTDRQRERERESLLPMRDTESTAECGTPRRVAAVDVDARPLLCPCPKTAL